MSISPHDPDPGNTWDPVWEAIYRSREWGKYPPEHVIRFVARNWYSVADRSTVRLLDLGCGPGACTWYMAREGFSVAGIDGSESAIRQAQDRLAREYLAADLRAGISRNCPGRIDSFDGVIDNFSLCHNAFSRCRTAVAEVLRVLKPDGRFFSACFTDRTWGAGLGREVGPGEFVDVLEGPLAGRGFVRFTNHAQIEDLFHAFAQVQIEKSSWTADGMKHQVESWIVQGRKPMVSTTEDGEVTR